MSNKHKKKSNKKTLSEDVLNFSKAFYYVSLGLVNLIPLVKFIINLING